VIRFDKNDHLKGTTVGRPWRGGKGGRKSLWAAAGGLMGRSGHQVYFLFGTLRGGITLGNENEQGREGGRKSFLLGQKQNGKGGESLVPVPGKRKGKGKDKNGGRPSIVQ